MSNFLLVVVMGLILGGCSSINSYFGLEDDNPYEEATEAAIKWETGLDVDLTPSSPEH
jgi:uncharacterized protein YceK